MSIREELKKRQRKFARKVKKKLPSIEGYAEADTPIFKAGIRVRSRKEKPKH
jgi:hypothetical protein